MTFDQDPYNKYPSGFSNIDLIGGRKGDDVAEDMAAGDQAGDGSCKTVDEIRGLQQVAAENAARAMASDASHQN